MNNVSHNYTNFALAGLSTIGLVSGLFIGIIMSTKSVGLKHYLL